MSTTDLDQLARLEEERRFLLRSLDDLEREHGAGDLDEADYDTLREDYTRRAATVLRAIEGGRATPPPPPARRSRRPLVIAGAVIALAVLAGLLVAAAAGDRRPGQSASGDVRQGTNDLLLKARDQTVQGDLLGAIKTYDQVLSTAPDNPEALAYRGWLLVQAGSQGNRPQLVDEGEQYVDRAIAADAAYPDAHFFKGWILLRVRQQPAAAVTQLKAFQASSPPADLASAVQELLDQATAAAGGAVPTTVTGGPTSTTVSP